MPNNISNMPTPALLPVIPAKAGSALQQREALVIHFAFASVPGSVRNIKMDPGFRRDDDLIDDADTASFIP